MELTAEYKQKVSAALLQGRENFGGSNQQYAKKFGFTASVYSRLKKGEIDGLLGSSKWLSIGRALNIQAKDQKWNLARTKVFEAIEEDVINCQKHGISLMYVDECEIGKSAAAKYLAQAMKNVFRIDCSQCKAKTQFIKAIAAELGLETVGRIADIKAEIKYCINILHKPVLIFDEAGDLEYKAFLEIKELWNAAEYNCGFYLIGADGLREKFKKGIASKKVGFRENFSRFGSRYMSTVPKQKEEKMAFYRKLVTDVLSVNVQDKSKIPQLVTKCLASDLEGDIAGLRRAKYLVQLQSA